MSRFDETDDPLAERLRAALHAEAEMVHPEDGLDEIRSRAGVRPWWQRPAVVAVAAAVVLGLAVGGAAAWLGGDDEGGVVAGQPSATATSGSATASQSPTPTPSETESDGRTQIEVYVYYVMDDPLSGPRLYREVHQVPGGPPPAAAAVQELLSEPARDPDYSSLWPDSARVASYGVSGEIATIELSDFVRVGAAFEAAAVQQVVYTVTANDPAVKRVRIMVNGRAPASGHYDWSGPVARAPMVDVQGLIWLLSPSEGETVSSPVAIEGYGTAFEGTVSWEVRRNGEVVAEGFTQGGSMGEFDEFRDTVELEPGTYEMRAFESSAEDGRPINVDTKTFTVR